MNLPAEPITRISEPISRTSKDQKILSKIYNPQMHKLLLAMAACLLVWSSGALNPQTTHDSHNNVIKGFFAAMAVMAGYCSLLTLNGNLIKMRRPHPLFWFTVLCAGLLYLGFLTFLLFQTREDARRFMKFLHPDLGVPLPEKSYGEDCRLYTPENPKSPLANVYDKLDEFVVAHALGWWGKAIVLRSHGLLWILSIGFELMEVSFKHMLPNFHECWWDSLVMDILLCNWLGIWAGLKTLKYFGSNTYDWLGHGSSNISSLAQKPHSLTRFVQVLGFLALIMRVELNTFFLKFVLWIPSGNPLVTYRLSLWWLLAIASAKECYMFVQEKRQLGAFAWLSIAICVVEFLTCVKFGYGLYHEPMPQWMLASWICFGLALLVFLMVWWWKVYKFTNIVQSTSHVHYSKEKKTFHRRLRER